MALCLTDFDKVNIIQAIRFLKAEFNAPQYASIKAYYLYKQTI